MQKTIISKALSLLLTLLLFFGIFATVQIASPTASAKTVGAYDVEFATGGNTAMDNGINATAVIGNSTYTVTQRNPQTGNRVSMDFTDVAVSFSGAASNAGLHVVGLTVPASNYEYAHYVYLKQGQQLANCTIPFNLTIEGNISDLELYLDFTACDVYTLTKPASKTMNGVTAGADFNYDNPYNVGEGEYVDPWVEIMGTSAAAGTYTMSLSSVKAGYNASVTTDVIPAGAVDDAYNLMDTFQMPAEDVDDFVLTATFSPSSSGRSSGSSSGSSSSNSNNNTSPKPPVPAPVNTATVVQSVKDAIAAAQNAPNGARVVLKNVTDISLATMQEMAKAAGNKPLSLNADNLNPDGSVDVRITLYPSKAGQNLNLSASTTSQEAQKAEKKFQQFFNNTVSVVSLSQKGGFGMPVTIAAKVSEKLNPKTLVFYSYDSKTNTYTQINSANYFVDKNGYVHFTTSLGGEIIISDKPLMRK